MNPKVKQHFNLSNWNVFSCDEDRRRLPGSRSQLQEGDLILSFNGKTVNTTHELFKELSKREILTMIDISVVRRTELLNFSIVPNDRSPVNIKRSFELQLPSGH